MKTRKYIIFRDRAFGDCMIAATFTAILNDNGIEASLCIPKEWSDLVDCPKIPSAFHLFNRRHKFPRSMSRHRRWLKRGRRRKYKSRTVHFFTSLSRRPGMPSLLTSSITKFIKDTDERRPIKATRSVVPVVRDHELVVPQVDVAMNTRVGHGPNKRWPWFDRFKGLLDHEGLSWIDLDRDSIYGAKAVETVARARVYVGLEAGMTHYVSSVANNAIVLLSGSYPRDVMALYDFDYLSVNVPCAPCMSMLTCKHNRKCMSELTPEILLRRVMEKLT